MALGKKKEAPGADQELGAADSAEIEDITAENSGKKGKKAKKPKTEKKGKEEKPVKLDKKGNPKKGIKTSSLLKVIIPLVLVLLVAAFVFEEYKLDYFNLGLRFKVLDFVNKLDPDYEALAVYNDSITQMSDDVELRESAVTEKEAELDERQSELDDRESELDERKRELDEFEADLEKRDSGGVPIYRKPMTEEEEADMNKLASIYKAMTPEAAAEILVELHTTEDITAILYFMSEKSAAPILEQFEVKLAAEITDMILQRRNALG